MNPWHTLLLRPQVDYLSNWWKETELVVIVIDVNCSVRKYCVNAVLHILQIRELRTLLQDLSQFLHVVFVQVKLSKTVTGRKKDAVWEIWRNTRKTKTFTTVYKFIENRQKMKTFYVSTLHYFKDSIRIFPELPFHTNIWGWTLWKEQTVEPKRLQEVCNCWWVEEQ